MIRTQLLILTAFLFLSSASLRADAAVNPDLGIYNLGSQDLSSALKSCLDEKTLSQCLSDQLPAGTGPVHVPAPDGDSADEELVNGWKNFLHSAIGNPDIFKAFSWGSLFGFAYGITRVDAEQVLSDANMVDTDTALGGQALWAVHTLEVAPGVYNGTEAAAVGTVNQSKSYYGGIFQVGGIIRLTKRHPLDQIYTDNFWGAVGKDLAIFKQSLPDYIRIPTELTGSGLAAGEGLQFEGYMVVEVGIGPTVSFGVTPEVPFLGAGAFGSAGLLVTWIPGHFNTRMEVQTDRTLRVRLERINQNSEKLDAQLNAGFVLGPFSFVKNIFNLEAGVTHTSETLLDLVFDPSFPDAQDALKEAYFGRFKKAQELATLTGQNYRGVREFSNTTEKERTTDRDFSFLSWSKGSEETHAVIDTQIEGPQGSTDDKTEIDEEDSHASGFFGKSSDMRIALRNDGDHPELGLERSMTLKYNFKASRPSSAEVQQFFDIAKLFGYTLTSQAQNKKPIQGYFFLSFDNVSLGALLKRSPADLKSDFLIAADQMPGAKDHLDEIEKFAQILQKALAQNTVEGQDQALVNGLRGKFFDLYPIGVLSLLVDRAHSLAVERATFIGDSGSETLEFPALGSQYVFPSQIEY